MGVLRSGEVMTSGTCPLKCKYCYIPKSSAMGKIHEEIIKDLESGEFIDRLETVYGEDLGFMGFWGTEPLLTLPLIEKHIPEIFRRFKNLKHIGFSTSLMVFPERVVDFAKVLAKHLPPGRELEFKVQISLDGPAFITDVSRIDGAARVIPKHFFELIDKLNDINLGSVHVAFTWKATHSDETVRRLVEEPERFDEYIEYFNDLFARFRKESKNPKVTLRNAYYPTLMMPGKYTTADGKRFAQYLREFHKRKKFTAYTGRMNRMFTYNSELAKRHVFSCSGGDSNLGIGKQVHICHRTFYYNDEEYIESILATDIDNWDVSLFKRGTIDHIKRSYIVEPDNLQRFTYVMRGYHDFWRFHLSYIKAMMSELALAGQVDNIESEELMELFALFINSCLSCPMENLLNTGSIHLQTVSLLRMFGNGAFKEILNSLSMVWELNEK